jgi:hypothetical protein
MAPKTSSKLCPIFDPFSHFPICPILIHFLIFWSLVEGGETRMLPDAPLLSLPALEDDLRPDSADRVSRGFALLHRLRQVRWKKGERKVLDEIQGLNL